MLLHCWNVCTYIVYKLAFFPRIYWKKNYRDVFTVLRQNILNDNDYRMHHSHSLVCAEQTLFDDYKNATLRNRPKWYRKPTWAFSFSITNTNIQTPFIFQNISSYYSFYLTNEIIIFCLRLILQLRTLVRMSLQTR